MLSFQLSFLLQAELIEPIRLYSGDLMRTSLVPRASPSPEMAVTSPEMAVAFSLHLLLFDRRNTQASPEMAVTSPEMAVTFRRDRANHARSDLSRTLRLGGGCRGAERTSVRGVALCGVQAYPRLVVYSPVCRVLSLVRKSFPASWGWGLIKAGHERSALRQSTN